MICVKFQLNCCSCLPRWEGSYERPLRDGRLPCRSWILDPLRRRKRQAGMGGASVEARLSARPLPSLLQALRHGQPCRPASQPHVTPFNIFISFYRRHTPTKKCNCLSRVYMPIW